MSNDNTNNEARIGLSLLTVGLAAEKQQETAWDNFWRESEPKERELFEKSYSRHKLNRHHGGTGEYEHRYVEHCWHGWMDRAFVIYTEAANMGIQGPPKAVPLE